jgi:hypothetical protein
MYYNAQATDCILSPQAICRDSNGYLTHWTQEGSTNLPGGMVTIYNKHGEAMIRLELTEKNGLLFYNTAETVVLNYTNVLSQPTGNRSTFLHTEEGIEYDDASLDWDSSALQPDTPAQANFFTKEPTSSLRMPTIGS